MGFDRFFGLFAFKLLREQVSIYVNLFFSFVVWVTYLEVTFGVLTSLFQWKSDLCEQPDEVLLILRFNGRFSAFEDLM